MRQFVAGVIIVMAAAPLESYGQIDQDTAVGMAVVGVILALTALLLSGMDSK